MSALQSLKTLSPTTCLHFGAKKYWVHHYVCWSKPWDTKSDNMSALQSYNIKHRVRQISALQSQKTLSPTTYRPFRVKRHWVHQHVCWSESWDTESTNISALQMLKKLSPPTCLPFRATRHRVQQTCPFSKATGRWSESSDIICSSRPSETSSLLTCIPFGTVRRQVLKASMMLRCWE